MPEPRADRPHDNASANAFERLVTRLAIAGRSLGPAVSEKTAPARPHLRLLRGGRARP